MYRKNSVKISPIFLFYILFFFFYCTLAHAGGKKYEKVPGGLNTLIEIGNTQKKMEAVLKEETCAYKKTKRGIESGEIAAGDTADDISDKYGEPVVKLSNTVTNTEKWIYKPGCVDFFSEEQIGLIFNDKGILQSFTVPPVPEDKKGKGS